MAVGVELDFEEVVARRCQALGHRYHRHDDYQHHGNCGGGGGLAV